MLRYLISICVFLIIALIASCIINIDATILWVSIIANTAFYECCTKED